MLLNKLPLTWQKVSGINDDELYSQMLEATEGGNLRAIFPYLVSKEGSRVLRESLKKVWEEKLINHQYQTEKLRMVWMGEAMRLSMGIDLDMWLEINGFPGSKVLETKLIDFLERDDLTGEIWQHLETEAGEAVLDKRGNRKEKLDFWEILEARSRHFQYGDNNESSEELSRRVDKNKDELEKLSPILGEVPNTFYMEASVRFGGRSGSKIYSYTNAEDEKVRLVVVDPRGGEIKTVGTMAHEYIGHALHQYSVYKAGLSYGGVPEKMREEIANLVKDAVISLCGTKSSREFWNDHYLSDSWMREEWLREPVDFPETVLEQNLRRISYPNNNWHNLPSEFNMVVKNDKGENEWPNFWSAYVRRRQAPYALTQLKVRQFMEERWKSGRRDMPAEDELQNLIDKFNPMVQKWYGIGVPLGNITYANVAGNLNPLKFPDGLLYLRKYVDGNSKVGDVGTERVDFKSAFEKRFGINWIKNERARLVLLALMAETGRNPEVDGTFVLNAEITELRRELTGFGIDSSKI